MPSLESGKDFLPLMIPLCKLDNRYPVSAIWEGWRLLKLPMDIPRLLSISFAFETISVGSLSRAATCSSTLSA